MSTVYFSCPKFTVRLVVDGTVIREAAPIVRSFQGQTVGALTAWAVSKFGGPIIVQNLSEHVLPTSGTDSLPRQSSNQSCFSRGNPHVYPSR